MQLNRGDNLMERLWRDMQRRGTNGLSVAVICMRGKRRSMRASGGCGRPLECSILYSVHQERVREGELGGGIVVLIEVGQRG